MVNQFNSLDYKELLELDKNNKMTFFDLELLRYEASIEYQICSINLPSLSSLKAVPICF